jgi:hypothetical protein
MPFGRKQDGTGKLIDFDTVYQQIIAPAVTAAGLEPIRADEEQVGGTIHKPMYERLMLCEFAVADVTGANPNVYYELGIRHAVRPSSTVIIFAEGTSLPFDIALLRGMPYRLDASGNPANPEGDRQNIMQRLQTANQEPHDDSPLFTLIQDMPRITVDHEKTDLFRDRVNYSREAKQRLTVARKAGADAVGSIAEEFPNLLNVEAGIVVDLFLSFRAVKAWHAPCKTPAWCRSSSPSLSTASADRKRPSRFSSRLLKNSARAARPTDCWAASIRIAGRMP